MHVVQKPLKSILDNIFNIIVFSQICKIKRRKLHFKNRDRE